MPITLQFLGGAGTVTGSKFLLTRENAARPQKTLIDCGLFQGLKELRLRNWTAFSENPRGIDQVVITHAHLDHCGYLPLLVKQGFQGPVYCTRPTRDLMKVILLDSAKIHEEDAEFANKKGYSKHAPALPLYTHEDAERALERIKPVEANEWFECDKTLSFRMIPNGHIMGSSAIELVAEGVRTVFSGDLGRTDPLLMNPPKPIFEADHIIVESTYGDRNHPADSVADEIRQAVLDAVERGGHLIIPAFAVGRSQDMIFHLSELRRQSKIPAVSVYLDSPMAIRASEILEKYPDWHRLSEAQITAMDELVTLVRTQQQSIEVMRQKEPAIVIAGSGMAAGGRVLHHLEARLPDPRNIILLTGYQAAGTRGRLLQDGCTELKFHGHYVPVRAGIRMIAGLSAHADQSEILHWLSKFRQAPRSLRIVHGEPQASDALRVRVRDQLGWANASIPEHLEKVRLE